MIMINDTEIPWVKGKTVEKMLKENNFLLHLSIVKINGHILNKNSFSTHVVNDNDNLKIIHLVAGG